MSIGVTLITHPSSSTALAFSSSLWMWTCMRWNSVCILHMKRKKDIDKLRQAQAGNDSIKRQQHIRAGRTFAQAQTRRSRSRSRERAANNSGCVRCESSEQGLYAFISAITWCVRLCPRVCIGKNRHIPATHSSSPLAVSLVNKGVFLLQICMHAHKLIRE